MALGFLHWAEVDPARLALSDDQCELDYATLRTRTLALAGRLRREGVAPEDIVGVACDRSVESIVGMLAVYCAGAAWLPLDLSYPSARLASMVRDARPRLIVAGPGAPTERLEPLGVRIIDATETDPLGALNRPVGVDAGAPAYVLFTSGSTGRPKGAVLSRRALGHMVQWHVRHPRLGGSARTLQFATLGFDSSVRDVFAPLAVGGSLIMAAETERRDPFRLLELMRAKRIERAFLPYVALRAIAHAHAEGGPLPASLRDLMTGGEALVVTPAIRNLFSALPGAVLYNEYGPTEACVFVTSNPLTGDPESWPDYPDIGDPLAHVRLHVTDEQLQPVPVGVEGELLIGGESLADGYINQPALTEARFVTMARGEKGHERVYRTGDRVRRDAGGRLAFLGRMDDQVKIAGFRVELGEVELAVASHAAVREVAVVAPNGPHGRHLVAFVVSTTAAPPGPELHDVLGRHLAARLPAFARPRQVAFLDTLPLTPNGKVDRPRLEKDAANHLTAEPTSGASLEEQVAALWRDLLAKPGLCAEDNVFDHGADSLLVMVFVTRLRALFDQGLDVAAVYDLPTVSQQARALAGAQMGHVAAGTPTPPSEPTELPREVPLNDGQAEKWLTCQYGEAAVLAFNESILLRFDGVFHVDAMQRALAMVWSRHEAFRLAFSTDGTRQCLNEPVPLPLVETDCSAGCADEAEERLRAFCEGQVGRPFDTAVTPLVRFALIRLGEHGHALHVVSHHLVMDGWSVAVFVRELAACYNAAMGGGAPCLPQPASFRQYVIDHHVHRANARTAALEYWRQLYASPPAALRLPVDRLANRLKFVAGTEFHSFTPALSEQLRNAARRHGVSLYTLLLSGFGVLVAQLSGQTDFAVTAPFAGLALGGHEALVGDDVSTLPLRMRVDPQMHFNELLRGTRQALFDAAAHRDTTLSNILRALALRGHGTQAALTGVSFNLLPRMPELTFEGLSHRIEACARPATALDLDVNVSDTGNTLALAVHYARDSYDAATVRRWIAYYETVLRAVVRAEEEASGGLLIADIPVLDEASRDEVLHAWNATAADYDRDAGVVALIEAQMHRTPARLAATCGDERMDFGTLEQATRAVAQALIRRGIGRGDMVGVCVPRSLDMLVAVLGILRSGAAYVPLDPVFPDARLRHMAAHARLGHVLVTDPQRVPAVVATERNLLAVVDLRAEGVEDTPLPRVHGDDLAYVLFTSGSTGEPKGVQILHRNLVNFLLSMHRDPGFGPDDVICAATTLSFDIAGLELYLPLIAGGRLVIATESQHRDPAALFELIERSGCTVLQITPSLLQLMQGLGLEHMLRRLRLFVGGEVLPLKLARALVGHCRGLWNLYGPTETTIWSTVARIHPGDVLIPLGKPIANTRVYVLDARGQPVPPGSVGEIWIGGDGVSDGYLFRPELTAERFVADPFAGAGMRMYRTGDLGCWREGILYFHGRADTQLKIRGHRIEPGDIEAAAAADPAVRECVAVARPFGNNDVRLVLYVVADGDVPEFAERLRNRLREVLPDYMRPQHIERLDALPMTPNGKIDRKALPAPAVSAPSETQLVACVAQWPDDPGQAYLAKVWRDIIGIQAVRPSDNFFDVGGHSLLAVEFTARVHRETGVRLNLLHVATSTLASLATELPESWGDARSGTLSLGGKLRRLFNR